MSTFLYPLFAALCVEVERNSLFNLLEVISSPLDDPTTIAEITQIRKLLKIIFNKLNEVMGLSDDARLLSYVK